MWAWETHFNKQHGTNLQFNILLFRQIPKYYIHTYIYFKESNIGKIMPICNISIYISIYTITENLQDTITENLQVRQINKFLHYECP